MGKGSPSNQETAGKVRVKVTDSSRRGLSVVVLGPDGGNKAFIREREISWERRVRFPVKIPQPGEVLEAVYFEDGDGRRQLSLCRLSDPWGEALAQGKYKVGQTVLGEVVQLRHFGAFVQVEPGIDALIRPRDVPLLKDQQIEDALWVGDKVSARIIRIDPDQRHMDLSIIERLEELDGLDERWRVQLGYFGAHQAGCELGDEGESGADVEIKKLLTGPRPKLSKLQRILVVDNERNHLDEICQALETKYRVEVDCSGDGAGALEKVQANSAYSLVVIDLQLGQEYGAELAERLRSVNPDLPFLFISSAPLADRSQYPILEEFHLCAKTVPEIIRFIDRMRYGESISAAPVLNREKDRFVRQLRMDSFANRPLKNTLARLIAALHQETNLSYCAFLEFDPDKQSITIQAFNPPLLEEEYSYIQSGLFYSPARDVLEDELEIYELDLDPEKYKGNFFPGLGVRSYLGVPVQVTDTPTRHAIFLLDEDPFGLLSIEEERELLFSQARLAALYAGLAIERATMLDYMRRFEERYGLGQLVEDLIHETNNKLTALKTDVFTLNTLLERRPKNLDGQRIEDWSKKLLRAGRQLEKTKNDLEELFEAYARQAMGEVEPVDVNEVILQVARQLAYTAQREGVTIYANLDENVPVAFGIRAQLKQVILNLLLNAVQMMGKQRSEMRLVAGRHGDELALLQEGQVVVQTRNREDDPRHPIEIRVVDSGPGIHWSEQKQIFSLGYSRRGGAGLGLYISRNLVERMEGRLCLADSMRFVGSVFVIHLPAA